MKRIGIIGGLGPPSTVKYYEWLSEGARAAGHHGARIILSSVDGGDIAAFRAGRDTAREERFFATEARRLEQAGADFILIASNTSHKNADAVEAAVSIPLLHLADATARHIISNGYKRVALLGTAPTMERDFYKCRLAAAGLDVDIPDADDRSYINEAIYDRLVWNNVQENDSSRFSDIVVKMTAQGSEGVILGCTELTLLGLEDRVDTPLFDTIRIHVAAALEMAMEEQG